MNQLLIVATLLLISYLLVEACSETATRGHSWFDVYPHLRVSKKKRTRGEVNRDGFSRREQAHRR